MSIAPVAGRIGQPPEQGAHAQLHAPEAEVAVLGALLLDESAIVTVLELGLEAEDFHRAAHQELFRTILGLYDRRASIDAVTVRDDLVRRGKLGEAGGEERLAEILSAIPTTANAGWHARIVRDRALRRRLLLVAQEIASRALTSELEAADLQTEAEQLVGNIADRRRRAEPVPIGRILPGVLERLEQLNENPGESAGLPSGYRDLDRLVGGFGAGDLVIAAGRASMGKTAWAMGVAFNTARRAVPTLVCSLEMPRRQLGERLLCAEAGISAQEIRLDRLGLQDWERIARAANRIAAASLLIDDTAGLSFPELRAKARRAQRKGGLGLLVVDYLQLMSVGRGERRENREQEVAYLSRSLKALARELEIPVIALCQLSRAVENRADNRPRLSDLRESGAIENDADLVVLLYREEYYHPAKATPGEAELNVAKNRNGPTGVVKVRFESRLARFVDAAPEWRTA